MRPDPFKRVGAYCFCRSVLFQPIDVFSRSWMMFPAGRIFSAVDDVSGGAYLLGRDVIIIGCEGILSSVSYCSRRYRYSLSCMLFPTGFVSRRYYLDRGAIALAVRGEGCKRWRAAYIPNIRNEKRAAFAGWPFTIWNIVILRANAYFASGHAAQSSVEQSPEQLI